MERCLAIIMAFPSLLDVVCISKNGFHLMPKNCIHTPIQRVLSLLEMSRGGEEGGGGGGGGGLSRGGRFNIVCVWVTYTIEDLQCIYMSSIQPVLHLRSHRCLLKRKLKYSTNCSFKLKFQAMCVCCHNNRKAAICACII